MKAMQPIESPVRGAEFWPLTLAAYHALGEAGLIPKRTELLYGFVYHKMSKSPFHSALVRQLLQLLQDAKIPGCFISSEQPITCHDSEPEPDAAVIRGSRNDFWHEHPHTAELVIEVCVTSHDFDRFKLRAYASAEVKECWLVLGPEKQIEVYRQPAGNQFAERVVHGPGGRVTSAAIPEFFVDLDTLFAK